MEGQDRACKKMLQINLGKCRESTLGEWGPRSMEALRVGSQVHSSRTVSGCLYGILVHSRGRTVRSE